MRRKKLEVPTVIAGWKDIATYLGKGVRTVQRYEREMGLPVRRPAGKSHAAVIATRAELDAWIAASPFRSEFSLHAPSSQSGVFTKSVEDGIAEMRRLREQMTGLRNEVIASVAMLRESVKNVHKDMFNTWMRYQSFPVPFDTENGKAVNLSPKQLLRKAS